ncbi:hypothetical protein FKP32DRAFT_1671207 [Trametes sanguinea]|nr:hypothetical protein FKP32DRAFT_1671207 [Trametes sanguinea]
MLPSHRAQPVRISANRIQDHFKDYVGQLQTLKLLLADEDREADYSSAVRTDLRESSRPSAPRTHSSLQQPPHPLSRLFAACSRPPVSGKPYHDRTIKVAKFRFTATATVLANLTTHIDVQVPSPPWRVRSVPTITRQFKSRSSGPSDARQIDGQAADSDSDEELDSEGEQVSSRGATPATEGQLAPSGSGSSVGPSALSQPDPLLDLRTQSISSSRKGKARQAPTLIRYPSVASNASGDDPLIPSTSRQGSVSRRSGSSPPELVLPPTDEAAIWTRFGVQNGQPIWFREHRISSTKDKNCITYWWASHSRAPLAEPPNISDQDELAIGDLFCNHIMGVDVPQTWICTSVGDGTATWNVIGVGDTRHDGRRLTITPTMKKPSWVTPKWCAKQLLIQQRKVSRA